MPTFGSTVIGGTNAVVAGANACRAIRIQRYVAGAADTVTAYWMYGAATTAAQAQLSGYTFVGGLPVTRISAATTTAMTNTNQWWNYAVSIALTNAVDYCMAAYFPVGVRVFYDSVATADSRAASAGLPAVWTQTITSNERYSIYGFVPSGRISSMIGFGGGLIGDMRGLIA